MRLSEGSVSQAQVPAGLPVARSWGDPAGTHRLDRAVLKFLRPRTSSRVTGNKEAQCRTLSSEVPWATSILGLMGRA